MKTIFIKFDDKSNQPKVVMNGLWIRKEIDMAFRLTIKELQNHITKLRLQKEATKGEDNARLK